jgi:ABC-type lipoprotein export system ATPase subunit
LWEEIISRLFSQSAHVTTATMTNITNGISSILVMGPDGSGKTHLCNTIETLFTPQFHKQQHPPFLSSFTPFGTFKDFFA